MVTDFTNNGVESEDFRDVMDLSGIVASSLLFLKSVFFRLDVSLSLLVVFGLILLLLMILRVMRILLRNVFIKIFLNSFVNYHVAYLNFCPEIICPQKSPKKFICSSWCEDLLYKRFA